jgi:flagellar biosynthesis protein FlhG
MSTVKNQAHGLEKLVGEKKDRKDGVRFICITSGKGGVGKSTISSNLSYFLWKSGFKVGVLDADIGLANLDVMFGVKSKQNILHLLKGSATLEEILVTIEEGLYLIPGESGEEILKYSSEFLFDKFTEETGFLDELDFVIVDTGAGIGEHVQAFLNASDDVIVVTATDPAAVTDAYATIKIISKTKKDIYMIVNMARSDKEAESIFEKITKVAKSYIEYDFNLKLLGKIKNHEYVSRSVKQRLLFSKEYENSEPFFDLESIAKKLLNNMEHKVLKGSEEGKFSKFFKKILAQF